jgi:hypothetical protein
MERLPGLQAELKLLIAEAAMVPMLESADREKMLENWQRDAFGEMPVQKASPEMLRMIGIGVKTNAAKSG